jgi:exosortase
MTVAIDRENIKAVILAGSRDFGRCPLASQLPLPLWPVMSQPVIKLLLANLAAQGIRRAAVCSVGDGELLRAAVGDIDGMEISYLNESLPLGTAGCIRQAADRTTDSLIIAMRAAAISPPTLHWLLNAHHALGGQMTVAFKPGQDGYTFGPCAEIYVCRQSVLDLIGEAGYCDIKENLIPKMVRCGLPVKAALLDKPLGDFHDRASYIHALGAHLQELAPTCGGPMIADNATVAGAAKIIGPAAVMDGATVSEGAVILGPAIIGPNAFVGKNTVVENSVLWDAASIGRNSHVAQSIMAYGASVGSNKTLSLAVVGASSVRKRMPSNAVPAVSTRAIPRPWAAMLPYMRLLGRYVPDRIRWMLGAIIMLALFVWSYLPQVQGLWSVWGRSDEYSSGMLVPFLAAYVLYIRRQELAQVTIKPSLWGLPIFLAAQALRYFGMLFMYASAERLSVVVSILAMTLLLFGSRMVAKTWGVLAFLFLMLPFPRSVHSAVMLPLQNTATTLAVAGLQTLGYAVAREGNIINISGTYVAVAEACNGLRMVTSFLVISSLVALLARRPRWEKFVLVFSSLPIALFCNTLRLIGTAIAFTLFDAHSWEAVFHDFGGYVMMPIALALIIVELWFLKKLFIVRQRQQIFFRGSSLNFQ